MDVDKFMGEIYEATASAIYGETDKLLKSGDIGKIKKESHELIPYIENVFERNGYAVKSDFDHIFVTKP